MVAALQLPGLDPHARRLAAEHRAQRRRLPDAALGRSVRDPGGRRGCRLAAGQGRPREVALSVDEIERANATGRTPVVSIHGLWLLPSSWARWAAVFDEAGYTTL